jgi:hypothetical protein
MATKPPFKDLPEGTPMSRDIRAHKVKISSARTRIAFGAIAALVAATGCSVIVWAPPAAAAIFSKHLTVDCPQPYSQSCPPTDGMTVTTQGPVGAQFIADPNPPACAPGYVQIHFGHFLMNEGTINPGGTLNAAADIPAGTYDVRVRVDGILGGCNTGAMSGWSGTLNVETDADAPPRHG